MSGERLLDGGRLWAEIDHGWGTTLMSPCEQFFVYVMRPNTCGTPNWTVQIIGPSIDFRDGWFHTGQEAFTVARARMAELVALSTEQALK